MVGLMKPNVDALVSDIDESLPFADCPGVPGADDGGLEIGGG